MVNTGGWHLRLTPPGTYQQCCNKSSHWLGLESHFCMTWLDSGLSSNWLDSEPKTDLTWDSTTVDLIWLWLCRMWLHSSHFEFVLVMNNSIDSRWLAWLSIRLELSWAIMLTWLLLWLDLTWRCVWLHLTWANLHLTWRGTRSLLAFLDFGLELGVTRYNTAYQ